MEPAARERPRDRSGRTLLRLVILGIALGSITYAIDPLSFIHPRLAVVGVLWMAAVAVAVRAIPVFQRRTRLGRNVEIAAMLVYATLLTASTGATSSPFISLYALPLIAGALSWKPWQVLLLALAIIGATLLQSGFLDAMNDMYLLTTAAVLVNVLAPAIAAALILAALQGKMGAVEQQVTELGARDSLTGLLNLQGFEIVLERCHREVERTGQPYSIVVVDIDDIRQVNETLGHEAGNQLIVAVGKAISRSIRTSDHAARMGGDVFILLLTDAEQATANAISQRIRNNVYNGTLLVENRMVRATVSIGVASCPRDERTPKALMILADQRMEQDKALRRAPGR